MNETQVLDGLLGIFDGHAAWPVVIGAIVLALCVLVKVFLTGKVHGNAKAWTFAVVGTLFTAASVAAGGGTDWVRGTIIALIGGFVSTGLLDLVKGAIPDIGKPSTQPPAPPSSPTASNDRVTPRSGTPLPRPTGSSGASSTLRMAVAVVALAVLLGTGCGAENRCLFERTTVAALGTVAGLASGLVPSTPEAATAMALVDSSIDTGETLVMACEQLRDDARSVSGWLRVAVPLVKAVLAIIRAAGVNIPTSVDDAIQSLERLLGDDAPESEAANPRFAAYHPEEW